MRFILFWETFQGVLRVNLFLNLNEIIFKRFIDLKMVVFVLIVRALTS